MGRRSLTIHHHISRGKKWLSIFVTTGLLKIYVDSLRSHLHSFYVAYAGMGTSRHDPLLPGNPLTTTRVFALTP